MLAQGSIEAGEEEILGRADARVVLEIGGRALFHDVGHHGPFADPRLVVAVVPLEAIDDPRDVAELAARGEGEERIVRPAIIAGKKAVHVGSS